MNYHEAGRSVSLPKSIGALYAQQVGGTVMTDKLGVAPAVCPMNGSCAEYLRIVDMIRVRQEQVAALNRLLDAHVIGADSLDDSPWVTHLPHS